MTHTCPYQKLYLPQKILASRLTALIVTFPYAYGWQLQDATYN